MKTETLDGLIASQTALIAALDSNDLSAIEHATHAMAEAVEAVRRQDVWHDRTSMNRLDYAMKQSHAARIRVNYLSQHTRQKIDRLEELRGLKPSLSYSKY